METTVSTADLVTVESCDFVDLPAIIELSAHELALVGGGMANVEFM